MSYEIEFNGIPRIYTVEKRDLTNDDPDYLCGEWYCLVETDDRGSEKVVAYSLSYEDAAMGANADLVFANSAAARASAHAWFAEALIRQPPLLEPDPCQIADD